MAESPEHEFLSQTFLEVVEELSRVRLYGLLEPDRRTFDFACVFQRDWSRPLVGQTLWKHSSGIDKDIRTLLATSDADVWAYIARDTVANRALLHEVVRDYRRTGYADQLFKLKLVWVPADFDADREHQREVVSTHLRDCVTTDILFNVVFGNLSSDDVRMFLSATGMIGLNLAVLHEIATRRFVNYPDMARRLSVSAGPLRERVLNLLASGMIWQLQDGSMYFASLRGRVFLELIRRILEELSNEGFSPELRYVLSILKLEPPDEVVSAEDFVGGVSSSNAFQRLIRTVVGAQQSWGTELHDLRFVYHPWELDPAKRLLR